VTRGERAEPWFRALRPGGRAAGLPPGWRPAPLPVALLALVGSVAAVWVLARDAATVDGPLAAVPLLWLGHEALLAAGVCPPASA
jgi:hypothetical protein